MKKLFILFVLLTVTTVSFSQTKPFTVKETEIVNGKFTEVLRKGTFTEATAGLTLSDVKSADNKDVYISDKGTLYEIWVVNSIVYKRRMAKRKKDETKS